MRNDEHTPFMVGGVYRRVFNDSVIYATLISAEVLRTGRKQGTMYQHGFPPCMVVEGDSTIDEWQLVTPAAHATAEVVESSGDRGPLESLRKRKAG